MVEGDRLARATGFRRRDLQRGGVGEPGVSVHDRDVASLGKLGEAAGERGDHLVFPGPQSIEIDRRLLEGDAPLRHLPRLGEYAADMQQRLRGDAAAEQAGAAEPWIAFHEGHLHPEIGRQKRGRVATGPSTKHHHGNVHLLNLPVP